MIDEQMTDLAGARCPDAGRRSGHPLADAVQRVRAEYEDALGRVIMVDSIDGWNETDGCDSTVSLKPPVRCRVIETPEDEVVRFMGEGWYDPRYRLEVVEEREELAGLTGLWVYGNSHNCESGDADPARSWLFEEAVLASDGDTLESKWARFRLLRRLSQ